MSERPQQITRQSASEQADVLMLGIDIGSKTVKIVVLDANGNTLYFFYDRHLSNVKQTLLYALKRTRPHCAGRALRVGVTGSAGIQFAEILGLPFVQEVLATKLALQHYAPETEVAIELGGEDSKILFLSNGNEGGEELRMNNTCAGGTGGFIDTIAGMFDLNAEEFNHLALGCSTIYPIASRCAVFAQSDVRPLLNEGVSRYDIAGSVFAAVATQCISGLACGRKIKGRVALLGGPFQHLSALRNAFRAALGEEVVSAEAPLEAHLMVAKGAAWYAAGEDALGKQASITTIEDLSERLNDTPWGLDVEDERLPPLFASQEAYEVFKERHAEATPRYEALNGYEGNAYLGIDSGSTTMKCVLLGEEGQFLFTWYERVAGDVYETAKLMLTKLYKSLPRLHDGNPAVNIAHTCVTGYGEDYLREAFLADSGEVETVAHLRAAQASVPDVDTVLDIGGQDIKYLTVRNGALDDIVLNEACSSGCGALIGGFAYSMNVKLPEFTEAALFAERPVDLGTRCTVFMTSRVRHAQKEGASVGEIAAGLAYSVVRNALFKVIRLSDVSSLGKRIIVQGGAFKSDAVLRAFELLSNREVYRSVASEYMGAYGAALIAQDRAHAQSAANMQGNPAEQRSLAQQVKSTLLSRSDLDNLAIDRTVSRCKLCPNHCALTISEFSDERERDKGAEPRKLIIGNRCSRPLQHKKEDTAPTWDLFELSLSKVFDYQSIDSSQAERGSIGILRALGTFEEYPLWHTFLTKLGFSVVLSDQSTTETYQRGSETIVSESACYPAKLSNGHFYNLVDKGLSTVFCPRAKHGISGKLNCSVLAQTALVLRLNMDEIRSGSVSLLSPQVDFTDDGATVAELQRVFAAHDPSITLEEIAVAYQEGQAAYQRYREEMRRSGEEALADIRKRGGKGIILAGRPYHLDPELHHGLPGLLALFGLSVFTIESIEHLAESMPALYVDERWEYASRVYRAAVVATQEDELDFVEMYSFGCGLDSVTCDQASDILRGAGKLFTSLKIDEVSDLAATKIRMRSMLAALEQNGMMRETASEPGAGRRTSCATQQTEALRVLLTNWLPGYAEALCCSADQGGTFASIGLGSVPDKDVHEQGTAVTRENDQEQGTVSLKEDAQVCVEALPQEDAETVLKGLACANNDACFSAIYAVGQLMRAVEKGDYSPTDTIVVPHTCVDCRAGDLPGLLRRALKEAGCPAAEVLPAAVVLRDTGIDAPAKALIAQLAHKLVSREIRDQLVLRMRPYLSKDELSEFEDYALAADQTPKDEGEEQTAWLALLKEAQGLVCASPRRKRIALVGTAPTLYNTTLNNHLAARLEAEGCEVAMPWYSSYVLYLLSHEGYVEESAGALLLDALEKERAGLARLIENVNTEGPAVLRPPKPLLYYLDKTTASGLATAQETSGAGWLYVAQVLEAIDEGLLSIVYAHSFGCLPAHTIGRGIFRELRRRYPELNILSLEYDPGASGVNQNNRLKLLTSMAR